MAGSVEKAGNDWISGKAVTSQIAGSALNETGQTSAGPQTSVKH